MISAHWSDPFHSTKAIKEVGAETGRMWKEISKEDKAHYDKEVEKLSQ